MLDVYLRGNASRISPEAPVPVVRVVHEDFALGGAANVAMNVVSLGAACAVVGCVGSDRAGQELLDELSSYGIDAQAVRQVSERPTTVKTRVMVRHQQVARYDREADQDLTSDEAAPLVAAITEQIARADVVVLEDYNKGVLVPAVIAAALEQASAQGKPVIVDPKFRNFFAYAGATVFKPNVAELSTAMRGAAQPDDAQWMAETRTALACEHLLVTLGEDGMALITSDGEYVQIPTVARSVYDVSGAGDTVVATLAVSLAAGATITEAAILANYAAGIEVAKAGVATVSADELREAVREHHEKRVTLPA